MPAPQINAQLQSARLVTFKPGLPSTLTPPPAPAPTSTGTKVAVGAAAVAGTSILTVAIISAVAGWSVQRTLDRAWDAVSGKKKR